MTKSAAAWPRVAIDTVALSKDRNTVALLLPFCREILRRRKHPYYEYKACDHPKRNQKAFHESEASIRLIFGGNQSGKSRAVAQEIAWWLCEDHPYQTTPKAPRIYVISASYRTVQEGVWRHLKHILPEWLVEYQGPYVAGYRVPSYIIMKAGGRVDFLSGEGREDARKKIQAVEIDLGCIDEEVDEVIWTECQARRLARGGRMCVSTTLVRSEPWCLELEDAAEGGSDDVHLFRLSTYVAGDYGHVKKNVISEMEASLTEEDRKVRLEGQSRRNEGLVYPGFGKQHVVEPFAIPKGWTRYCAIDPGWRTFAVVWIAVAPDGKYYIYRELYLTAKHYKEIVDAIFAAEGHSWNGNVNVWTETKDTEKIYIRWIDPSAFGHHETGELKVGNLLAQQPFNLYCAPARNDVEAGIAMCARSLMPDVDGISRCRVFNTCTNFIKEARSYRRGADERAAQKNERSDAPIKRHDHLMDGWRYCELGGLSYVEPTDPRFRRPTKEELAFPFKASTRMAERLEQNWLKVMERQAGHKNPPPHIGGLGSEY